MKKPIWNAFAILATATALAACGSGADSTTSGPSSMPTVTAPVAPSATATPTTTGPMSKAAAGAYYLSAVCVSNDAIDAYEALFKNGKTPTLKRAKANAKAMMRANRTGAGMLDEPPQAWPPKVQKDIDKVVTSLLQDVTASQSMSKAKTYEAYLDATYALGNYSSTAAQRVRLRLGLGATDTGC